MGWVWIFLELHILKHNTTQHRKKVEIQSSVAKRNKNHRLEENSIYVCLGEIPYH